MLIKREYVKLRNFWILWKGRGGGQELSAEVIRASDRGGWYPVSDQYFCFKHISLICVPIGEFFRWFRNA